VVLGGYGVLGVGWPLAKSDKSLVVRIRKTPTSGVRGGEPGMGS
jgi:hypothetical protein